MRHVMLALATLALVVSGCATQAPSSSPAGGGTLGRIKDTGVARLGFRESSAPFSYAGAAGRPAGYSIDLCTRIVAGLRQQLAMPDIRIEWVAVTPGTRIQAVVDGAIDLECGSTTNTLSRQERVDFSHMTFVDGASLLVRLPSSIGGIGDLAGKRVAVIPGTTTESVVRDALAAVGVRAQMVPVKEHSDGLAAIDTGAAEAYASDRVLLIGLALTAPGATRRYGLMERYLSYEPYALMLRRGDSDFRLAVNRELSRIYRSGQIAEIYNRWLGVLGPPSSLVVAMYSLHSLPE